MFELQVTELFEAANAIVTEVIAAGWGCVWAVAACGRSISWSSCFVLVCSSLSIHLGSVNVLVYFCLNHTGVVVLKLLVFGHGTSR